jgi:hypothetical protein
LTRAALGRQGCPAGGCDYVAVYDGQTANAPLIGKYSGHLQGAALPTVVSTGEWLRIEFMTDAANCGIDSSEDPGWFADWVRPRPLFNHTMRLKFSAMFPRGRHGHFPVVRPENAADGSKRTRCRANAIVLAPMLLPRTMVERVLNVANIQSWIYDRLTAACPKEPCPVDRKFHAHPTLRASSVSPTPVMTMVMMTTTLGCN